MEGPGGRAYLMIGLAIFGWGLSTSLIELGLPYFGPLQYLGYRFLITALVLTPFVLVQRRKQLMALMKSRWMWYVAWWEAIGLIVQYLGQEQGVPAGLSALLSLIFILIVPFMSPLVLGEKLRPMHLVAAGIAFAGVAFIAVDGDLDNIRTASFFGVVLLLGAAFSYASYIVCTSRLRTQEMPEVDTVSLFYLAMVMIAVMTMAAAFVFEGFEPPGSVPALAWLWLGLLVAFSTLLAFFTYFEALKTLPANTAAVLLPLQTLVPMTIDYLFIGRRYSGLVLLGSLLILSAMALVVTLPYLEARRSRQPELEME